MFWPDAGLTRRVLAALIIACLIAFAPWATQSEYPAGPGILAWIQLGIACLAIPGLLVNLIVSGNVHNGALWVVHLGNVLFYFCVTYYMLAKRASRKEANRVSPG
jgi:hypothetical protein